ncbi:hypothetical protein SASPL_107811 [Salvia splendens]|uniref:Uncharacterized protein n=1 Tax=Salvia splendens TaxID=180675 RepID=A0A8X8YBY6_SALSN|nr:hypothetical protein SASPL_107811 [Salvia splendens]
MELDLTPKDDSDLVVLFLGDTSKAHKSGFFTDFFLTGFSTEFVGRAWDLDEGVVKTLVGSQKGNGIVKLDPSLKKKEQHYKGMVLNCEEAPLDVDIKNGGPQHQEPAFGEVAACRLLELTESASWKPPSRPEISSLFRGSLLSLKLLMMRAWTGSPLSNSQVSNIAIFMWIHHCRKDFGVEGAVAGSAAGIFQVEEKFTSKRKAEEIFFPPPN